MPPGMNDKDEEYDLLNYKLGEVLYIFMENALCLSYHKGFSVDNKEKFLIDLECRNSKKWLLNFFFQQLCQVLSEVKVALTQPCK